MEEETRKVITATEFKQNLGMYLDYVADNHEVIITKNGDAIVRISPYVNSIMQYMYLREQAPKYDIGASMVSYEEFLEISSRMEGRLEYINGQIIMQSTPNSFHQEAVGELYVILKSFFKDKGCKVFLAPFDVTLYKDKEKLKTPDVVQPDLLVACDAKSQINEKGRYHGVPDLVIEVLSPSTRSIDMVEKLNIFMKSGCKEYWIIDVDKQVLYQYGFNDRQLDINRIYHASEELVSYAFEALTIKLEDIWIV